MDGVAAYTERQGGEPDGRECDCCGVCDEDPDPVDLALGKKQASWARVNACLFTFGSYLSFPGVAPLCSSGLGLSCHQVGIRAINYCIKVADRDYIYIYMLKGWRLPPVVHMRGWAASAGMVCARHSG